ncbi:MAG: ABC transporter ATP-binding protein [Clostridiaceae bacterium]|jgi:iron complex transport system ATP-binding protein|nr:ABC transporter ATP-binding protein [Clostridiaceae bacterium]
MEYFFYTKQLTVGYNGKPLIKDIEIRLNKGQILTLIGPNGSGKSTILKSITKHLKKIYGTVYIDNRSIDDMSNRDMSYQVSVVLTEKLKTELMTCEDVVETGRYPYTGMLGILSEQDKLHVRNAMELVNAWDLRDKDFTRVSDGQRQRIMLARAICQEPQIIVLDEPTSFLDVRYELELLNILRSMAEDRDITVIMSLHELDMAQKVSDLVMCVKGEYITHFGSPREIFQRDLISELYELSNGSYNPLFGSFEMERPTGGPKVFVIAGGGTGIPEYRRLQKKRIPFVTGILHENDIDYQVAYDLASEVFVEKSFERIGEDTYKSALRRLESCDTVINCLKSYGEMNEKNKELYEKAVSLGLKILKSTEVL